MNLSWQVEIVTVNKSEEKRSDIYLITIKTYKEIRPFTVKAVVDAVTDRQMSVHEAQAAGILDQQRGIYINKSTGDHLSLADALDSGLLIVEFDQIDANSGNGYLLVGCFFFWFFFNPSSLLPGSAQVCTVW